MDGQLYLVLLIKRSQIWIDPVRRSIINFTQSENLFLLHFYSGPLFVDDSDRFMNENIENQAEPFLAWFISANLNAIHFAFFFLFFTFTFVANKYHWRRLSVPAF